MSPFIVILFQERASAEIRGEFFQTKSRVNFAGDFLVDFFRGFFLGKNRRKKSTPKNPRQNSNRNLGVSRPKSTLQGSGLDTFRTMSWHLSENSRDFFWRFPSCRPLFVSTDVPKESFEAIYHLKSCFYFLRFFLKPSKNTL